jgi:coenzyme F420 biosynthesis associated uncharacterized protein
LPGLGATYLQQRIRRNGDGLVDWGRVERLAAARLERLPGKLSAAEIEAASSQYNAAMRRLVPALEGALGVPLPGVTERQSAVTRVDWARANLVTFRTVFERLEAGFGASLRPPEGDLGATLLAIAGRGLFAGQLALFLGYLGSRVLGQYDLALLAAESQPGQLLFVEENIRATAAILDVPLADFRLWIALHETTHAFEFEAHPWLRPYLAERLERSLTGLIQTSRPEPGGGAGSRWSRLWSNGPDQAADSVANGWLERFLDPAARRNLAETQAVMSLLEGYADWIMDQVGVTLLPNVAQLRERFEARRNTPRRGFDAVLSRLMGMDVKLAQYHSGERFVAGVAAAGGPAALARLWAGPEFLPNAAELADPAVWIARVGK